MKKQPNRKKQPAQPTEQKPASTAGGFFDMEAKAKITTNAKARLIRSVPPMEVSREAIFFGALGVAHLTNRGRLTMKNLRDQWQGCLETACDFLHEAEKRRRQLSTGVAGSTDMSYGSPLNIRREIRARWQKLDPDADTGKDNIPSDTAVLILTGQRLNYLHRAWKKVREVVPSATVKEWESRGEVFVDELLPYWGDFLVTRRKHDHQGFQRRPVNTGSGLRARK